MGVKFLGLPPEVRGRIGEYLESQKNRNIRLENEMHREWLENLFGVAEVGWRWEEKKKEL
jgi:hypothetical protein